MTRLQPVQTLAWITAVLLTLSMSLVGCASPAAQAQTPRLRIVNSGSEAIKNLVVLFPDDEIEFGDVPAGATTEYKHVPNGVYNYAAYRHEIDGQMITQPVIDWVGEEPWPGKSFTYTLALDPRRPPLQMIQLVEVTQDE